MFERLIYYVGGQRSHLRIKCQIPVDYVVNQQAHRDFIENISKRGAYIGTKRAMKVGSNIVMTFLWQDPSGRPIKSSGKIVRSTNDGFAVRFKEPITIH